MIVFAALLVLGVAGARSTACSIDRPGQRRAAAPARATPKPARDAGARVPRAQARRRRGGPPAPRPAPAPAPRAHGRARSGARRRRPREARGRAEIQGTVLLGPGVDALRRRQGRSDPRSRRAPSRSPRASTPCGSRPRAFRLREEIQGRPQVGRRDPLPVPRLDARHPGAGLDGRAVLVDGKFQGTSARRGADEPRRRAPTRVTLSREGSNPVTEKVDGSRRSAEDMDAAAALARGRGGNRCADALAVLLGLRVCSAAAVARAGARLEAEAKKAFDSGRFKEAGEKYAKAAEDAGRRHRPQGRAALQSAWAYYIAGNSKSAREELKARSRRGPTSRSSPTSTVRTSSTSPRPSAPRSPARASRDRHRGAQAHGPRQARRRQGRGGALRPEARRRTRRTRRSSA